jgi:hypothetical protein
MLSQQGREFAICRQTTLLLAASEKEVLRSLGVRRAHQHERIVFAAGCAPTGSEDGMKMARLCETLEGKSAAGTSIAELSPPQN